MFRRHLLFLTFLLAIAAHSQQITLSGRVVDSITNLPLESATVYLETVQDSAMVDYTLTDKTGAFAIKTRKVEKPSVLKFSFMGFETKKIAGTFAESRDFGTVALSEAPNMLGEVVVKSEIPPVRVKNDTLEFNASSFRMRPDANVEALVKQLPGVEIDADGKITVNGKEVKQILVNGKPFFDENGKIAMQNLPAELINKVQVTDLKTKKEELTKQAASSDEASINLTIDEKKNKGFFGKATAGAGSDKRYESSLIANYFEGPRKVSVLASSNNINASGFSMNEVFDAMGGGRNSSFYMMDNGAFAINNTYFGSETGITQTHLAGGNYADQWFKDFETALNYFYVETHMRNNNRTDLTTFLPQGSFNTRSQARFRNDRLAHNAGFRAEYKIDSTATIYFEPKFSRTVTRGEDTYSSVTRDQEERLTNEVATGTRQEFISSNFSYELNFNKSLTKKGRAISADLDGDIRDSGRERFYNSSSTFYDDLDDDGTTDQERVDLRNQRFDHADESRNTSISFEYTEPIVDSVSLTVGARRRISEAANSRDVFDFDAGTGGFTDGNDLLTNRQDYVEFRSSPFARFSINKKKYNLQLSGGAEFIDYNANALYLGERAQVSRNLTAPEISTNLNYRFSTKASLYFSYSYRVNMPWMTQLLPIADLSDPLHTITGNPDLDPSQRHSFYGNFRNYDHSSKSGYNFYGGGGRSDRVTVARTTYADTGERSTTYVNVDGVLNSWWGFSWNKSKKIEAHSFKYSFGINGGFDRSKGFTNGQLFLAESLRLTPQASFTYDYGELLSVNPSYSFTSSTLDYQNYIVDRAVNLRHRANLMITSYWPKHVVFGNDFTYTYNSNIAGGFRKDFFLWNASLGYNFLDDKLLAKVKVYDVLDQNQNATRSITATSVRDEQNDVLKRYVMFSLTFKLDKFAGKPSDR